MIAAPSDRSGYVCMYTRQCNRVLEELWCEIVTLRLFSAFNLQGSWIDRRATCQQMMIVSSEMQMLVWLQRRYRTPFLFQYCNLCSR